MQPIPLDGDILNRLLEQFSIVSVSGITHLTSTASRLLVLLGTIDLILIILLNLNDGNHMKILIKKVLTYGFFIAVIKYFPLILEVIIKGFTWVGLVAGGVSKNAIESSITEVRNPTAVVGVGINLAGQIFNPLLDALKVVTGYNAGGIFFFKALVALLIFLCYAVMGIQIFMTYVEFYIVGAVSLILIPFGTNKHTAFICEKSMGAVISFGIKLMVLTFIATIIMKIAPSFKIEDSGFLDMNSMNQCFYALTGSLALMILTWHAPNIVSGLMAGSPTLTASTALSPFMTAAQTALQVARDAAIIAGTGGAGAAPVAAAEGASAAGAAASTASQAGTALATASKSSVANYTSGSNHEEFYKNNPTDPNKAWEEYQRREAMHSSGGTGYPSYNEAAATSETSGQSSLPNSPPQLADRSSSNNKNSTKKES